MTQDAPLRVTVWDENPPHAPKDIYPQGINGAIAEGLQQACRDEIVVRASNLDDKEQGAGSALLADTDVLLWWGHMRHGEVNDLTAQRVVQRVHEAGMGFIALHSAHYSKTFQQVIGGPGHLKGGWREMNPPETEFVRVCAPWHPIAAGIQDFTIDQEEMYGAPFEVPAPLEVIFQSHFPHDRKTFPSGLCWTVGKGKTEPFTSGPGEGVGEGFGVGRVFYFRPGHESVPTYRNPIVRQIIANAVRWCGKRS